MGDSLGTSQCSNTWLGHEGIQCEKTTALIIPKGSLLGTQSNLG